MAGHTAPVHRATLNCVVPKKLGLFSYEQAYQPLRIGSFQREVQLWDVAPPSDENRSRGDGLDKSQLASGCSIKKKETRILPNSTPILFPHPRKQYLSLPSGTKARSGARGIPPFGRILESIMMLPGDEHILAWLA